MKIRSSTQVSFINDNGNSINLPKEVVDLPSKNGIFQKFENIDNAVADTMATPLAIDLPSSINGLFAKFKYAESYFADGIEIGAPAKLEVEFNESGVWMTASGVSMENFSPTHFKLRTNSTRKILVEVTISAE